MKKIAVLIIGFILAVGVNLKAEDTEAPEVKIPKELQLIQTEYQNSINSVTAPIKKKTVGKLEALKKKYGASGEIDNAVLVDNVIKEMTGKGEGAEDGGEPVIEGKGKIGLSLKIGDKKTLWDNNSPISLPSDKTPVSINGYINVPERTTSIKLRSSNSYGSERLKFSIEGDTLAFSQEKEHRFVIVPDNMLKKKALKIEIGDSASANEWDFGQLEWSINGKDWTVIPKKHLFIK